MLQKKAVYKKYVAAVLTVAVAGTVGMPVLAAEPKGNTQKEEVVYANLNTDGSVKEVNVVNIFDQKQKGQIVDYGDYQSVRNMTTTDEIKYTGDTVKIDAAAGKLYYEGKLTNEELPWNISIDYFLDGEKISPENLAGKSGALKIALKIEENKDGNNAFFDGYALQTSFSLDTDQCKNIQAKDATLANVGSDKQITYTILPGKGIDTEVTADVTDFEMDGIAINGIPLGLDVEVDDEKLLDRVNELLDAIGKLDDGAGELQDGTKELKNGGKSLNDGVSTLNSGAETLDQGVKTLNSGMEQLQAGLSELNGKSSSLTGGSAKMKRALSQLQASLNSVDLDALTGSMPSQGGKEAEALKTKNAEAIQALDAMTAQADPQTAAQLSSIKGLLQADNSYIEGTQQYMSSAANGMSELTSQLTQLKGAVNTLVSEYSKLDSGINDYTDGVAKIVAGYDKISGGAAALQTGSSALKEGSSSLSSGTENLVDGILKLYAGTGKLKDGTKTMKNETSGMDTEVEDQIDELLKSVTGDDFEPESFVSEKNTNIDSVQFVIQTEGIQMEEEKEVVDEEPETLSVVQKFLKLFGLE